MYQALSTPQALTYHVESASTASAIELATVKEFLAFDSSDTSRDTELNAFILTATKAVEVYIGMKLLTTTMRAETNDLDQIFRLETRPFRSLEKIDYVKSDGVVTEVSSDTYHSLKIAQHMAEIYLGENNAWPTDNANRGDAFRVHFTVGFGETATDVPNDIRHALLMTIAVLDEQRGDCECGGSNTSQFQYYTGGSGFSGKAQGTIIPNGAEALLRPYKLFSIGVI